MITWRIYYADGSTFDSDQGLPEQAPPTGVICIKQCNQMHGWTITAMKDFYLLHDDAWWGADAPGFWQHMFRPGAKVVLFGVSVPDELFHKIMSVALNDSELGDKSARSPLDFGEGRPWT
jgi:hypothetical protein